MIGSRIAHYEITGKLGEGGMGEVYRARDGKLNRDVALKLMPEAFTRDAQRMARFEREAQVLASLNHPSIGAIYGIEDSDSGRCLVLELVEGPTLEDRLREGPLEVGEALKIALQIAEALEAAHEQGIIHRDLKPSNIKVTPAGSVKVLDFGLAKAIENGEGSSPDLTRSPTITEAATQAGIILGTAGYMSPEQARGQASDRRSDIWSFGVVLLEMLTGSSPFHADTVSDTLARVLERQVTFDDLPDNTPQAVRRMLRRALDKDAHHRLQAIGDARLTLEEVLGGKAEEEEIAASATVPTAASGPGALLPWGLAIAALAVLAASFWWQTPPQPELPLQMTVEVTPEAPFFVAVGTAAVLSPDGSTMAFVVDAPDQRNLYVRELGQLESTPLSGSEGAYDPFFSPDGQWIAFFSSGKLRKVSTSGGAPLTLCDAPRNRGGAWGPGDEIVFSPSPGSGLMRVSASGGAARPLTELDTEQNEVTHRWPQFLPGGKAVLFTSNRVANNFDDANIEVVDLETGQRKLLHQGGSDARYSPSGHIVYIRESTLFALPFDLASLEVTGSPSPVLEGVMSDPAGNGAGQFSFSQNGRMIYLSGTAETPKYAMVHVERDGRFETLEPEPQTYGEPHISPDGSSVAVNIVDRNAADVWVYDLRRNVSTRLTFNAAEDYGAVWSPDGKWVGFSSTRDGSNFQIYRKPADGSGDAEQLTEDTIDNYISSWSHDGRYVLFTRVSNETANDIAFVEVSKGLEPQEYLVTPFSELEASFSPDDRWIAYQSDESGRTEVFVRPFPGSSGKWQISVDGGSHPRWSPDGGTIYYRQEGHIMAASVTARGDSLVVGKARQLFEGSFVTPTVNGITFADYDVGPDDRFVMFTAAEEAAPLSHVTFATSWFDRLRGLAGR